MFRCCVLLGDVWLIQLCLIVKFRHGIPASVSLFHGIKSCVFVMSGSLLRVMMPVRSPASTGESDSPVPLSVVGFGR